MTAVSGYLLWSFASALIGGAAALALNKWATSWSWMVRFLVAEAASILPTFGMVAFFFFQLRNISLWTSPDEFLLPFALQVFLIFVVSTPTVWLVSRRRARKPAPTDVFD